MMQHKNETPSLSLFSPHLTLTLGIILIAANLRPAITSVGPLIGAIRDQINVSHGMAGMITTLPLIAFAIFSPLAPKMSRRFGNERMLFIGLITLFIGILIRSVQQVAALFAGTFLVGVAIAICNVLLPALIKHRFPGRVGLMTGAYSSSMGVFAALGSGMSVPLAQVFSLGWQGSLACWAILAALAAILWLPKLRKKVDSAQEDVKIALGGLWRSPLAWQVTLFMGLQSFVFYVTITWLPEILHDRGLSVSSAGWLLSFMQFVGLPATFMMPVLADRQPNQRLFVVVIGVLYFVGLGGLLIGSTTWTIVWITFLGLSLGASISLSLAFLGLRARNAEQAAELSGMAQSVGYLLAAIGPVLFGYLHDLTNSWASPLIMLLLICVFMLVAGLGAGRPAYVTPNSERTRL